MSETEFDPRSATALFGHGEAEKLLRGDLAAGKLAHGWIIGGPKGIGKATLAYRFARTLLSGQEELPPEHPVFRRMLAGSHADLLVVEPVYDEKKGEYARELSVDQARSIAQFLSKTPGESDWRVVIVDPVDALNVNGANAILKILEEPPPQTVLLLVSHNPGLLLPTIRSRCRTLRLKPLSRPQFEEVMRHSVPDIEAEELDALALLSDLSPGVALELKEQEAAEMYGQIVALVKDLPKLDTRKLHAFAEKTGSGRVHANWQIFMRLCLFLLERLTQEAAGAPKGSVSWEEGQALRALSAMYAPAEWAARWQQCAEQFSLAQRLHLDYKQVIITFFHSISSPEGFQIGNAA